ncbi:TolC family protein [Candidatus Kapabacteria bacterium]|nr:TolC family protein [Candidatus Kapabacteria bacterium]
MRKLNFLIIFILFTSINLFSQRKLSIEEAIDISLQNNHNIKIAEYDLEIAEQDVKEAFSYALPSVNLNSSYTRNVILPKFVFGSGGFGLPDPINQFIIDAANDLNRTNPFTQIVPQDPEPVAAGLKNALNTTIELNQTLFNYTVINGIGATGIYKKALEENLNSKESITVKDSRVAFYSALLANESIGLVEQSLENAEKRFNEISILFENGLVSEFDKLRSSVQVENLKSEKQNSETNFQNALNRLKITIGISSEEEIQLVGNLEEFQNEFETIDKSETQNEIIDGNYDLKAIDLQIEVQDAFVDSEVANYYPVLNLFANYSYLGQSDDFDFITFDQSAVGLRLSWNLFNGFRRSATLQKAKINKQKAEVQKDLLSKSLTNQGEMIALRMNTSRKQIETGIKTVKQAERGYEIANTRYQEGVGSLLEINDADLALRQSKLNKLQAVYSYLTAKAEFENLKGNK